jgi:hypothetical protein
VQIAIYALEKFEGATLNICIKKKNRSMELWGTNHMIVRQENSTAKHVQFISLGYLLTSPGLVQLLFIANIN